MKKYFVVFMLVLALVACKKKNIEPQSWELPDTVDSFNFITVGGTTYYHMKTKESTIERHWDHRFMVLTGRWWNKVPYVPCSVYVSYPGTRQAHIGVCVQTDSMEYSGIAYYAKVTPTSYAVLFDSVKVFHDAPVIDSSHFFYISGQWRL